MKNAHGVPIRALAAVICDGRRDMLTYLTGQVRTPYCMEQRRICGDLFDYISGR